MTNTQRDDLLISFSKRFDKLTELLIDTKAELRAEIKSSVESVKQELRAEIKDSVESVKQELRAEIKDSVESAKKELKAEIFNSSKEIIDIMHDNWSYNDKQTRLIYSKLNNHEKELKRLK